MPTCGRPLAASLVLPALIAVVGCSVQSGNGADSGRTTQRGAPPVTATPAAEDKGAVCALMPLQDVAKIVNPALARQKKVTGPPSMSPDYSMCHYLWPGFPNVQVGIELTNFEPVKRARESFAIQRAMEAKNETIHDFSDLPGYGDSAYVADSYADFSAGVSVLTGTYILRTIVGEGEQPFDFRVGLAKALAQEVLKRHH